MEGALITMIVHFIISEVPNILTNAIGFPTVDKDYSIEFPY